MNRHYKLISQVLIFMAICSSAIAQKNERSITVTGSAQIQVIPDEVILRLGIETMDKNLATAKADNDTRTTAIIAATESIGVARKHIGVEHMQIAPEYKYSSMSQQLKQYKVRKTLVITLKETDKFEAVLTAALEAGANYVHGVDFRTTELRKFRDQARALAITAAKEKAQALSTELNESVGGVLNIQEGNVGWRSSYGAWWGRSGGGGLSQNVVQSNGGSLNNTSGPTTPGQIGINASITVTFALQ